MIVWHNFNTCKPPIGVEVVAYHHKWINKDFNPTGQRVGFLSDDGDFTSAYWCDYQDNYMTIAKWICESHPDFYVNHLDNTQPEYWTEMPKYSDAQDGGC